MNRLLKMKLQLLADAGEAGASAQQTAAEEVTTSSDETNADNSKSDGKGGQDDAAAKKYTDDDVNRIVKDKLEKYKKKQAAELDEAAKLAEMNAQQKAEYERDKLKQEIGELRAEIALSGMSKTARQMLKERSINADDELINMLVAKDAETTKENVDKFTKLFADAVEKSVNERIKGKTPERHETAKLSKAEILAVKDKQERRKLIAANIGLFE